MSTVLITGGSRGIGAAAVKAFAARGDRVFFFYKQSHREADALCRQTGSHAVCCDVADGNAVRDAVQNIGDVDILICNAGIARYGLFQDVTEDQWDNLFDVNVKGIYHCVNAVLPGFLKKQSGSIVTVSSMWGITGGACEAAYSATKGAVIALTKALAKELGPSNIRVNCVAPGVILTDMCGGLSEETLAQLAEETPLGRNGTPEDVANTMLYLADAPFVTGQVLSVNGGLIM